MTTTQEHRIYELVALLGSLMREAEIYTINYGCCDDYGTQDHLDIEIKLKARKDIYLKGGKS
jgi:hypothetical protein